MARNNKSIITERKLEILARTIIPGRTYLPFIEEIDSEENKKKCKDYGLLLIDYDIKARKATYYFNNGISGAAITINGQNDEDVASLYGSMTEEAVASIKSFANELGFRVVTHHEKNEHEVRY